MKNTNSLLNDAWAALSKNKAALISATTMAVMVLMVLFGPIFSPYTIDETDWYKMGIAAGIGGCQMCDPGSIQKSCLRWSHLRSPMRSRGNAGPRQYVHPES